MNENTQDGIDLGAIRVRAEAATEGPWINAEQAHDEWFGIQDLWDALGSMVRRADAEFIAHARTDVPALLAAVAERDAEIGRQQFDLEQARLSAGHAEEYARHTDALVGIIRDAQERLARPGQRLSDVKEILHRLPHAARQEREDRQLRDRDNTPLATRIAERAELEAEVERLRSEVDLQISRVIAENARYRAVNRRLGAVAALAKKWIGRGVMRSVSGTVAAECGRELAAVLAPVSGAVEEAGVVRHFAPYGSYNATCDETVPTSTPWDVKTGEYATDRFTVQREKTTCPDCRQRMGLAPVAVHEQEVRADWEYGFTYVGPNGVKRTEWGFADEPVPDSDGEIEVNLDEWVTVTSIVRRRFAASETVRDLTARTPGVTP